MCNVKWKLKMNKKIYHIILMLLFVFITHHTSHISQCFGAFKDWHWGTRPAGMGGAFCAIADDINAPLWNPAGLAQLKNKEVTFMYAKPYLGLENVNFGLMFLGYAHPISPQLSDSDDGELILNWGVAGINCTNFYGTELYRENSLSLSYAKEIYQMKDVIVQEIQIPVKKERIVLKKQNFGSFAPFYIQDRGVKFMYESPESSDIYLVGDFNDWDSKRNLMNKNPKGVWVLFVPLTAGKYEYRFMADGQLKPDENFIISVKQNAEGKLKVEIPLRRKKIVREYTRIEEKITEKTKGRFYVGINLKYLTHKYFWDKSEKFQQAAEYYNDPVVASGDSAGAVTVDLGILAKFGEKLSVGLAGKNLTQPDVGLYYEDKVPTELRFGLAYKIPHWEGVSGLDFSYRLQEWGESSDKLNIHLGGEKWFAEHTYGVRLGVNKDEMSLGGSFAKGFTKRLILQIDYAIIWSFNIADNLGSHRISTTAKF